MARPGISQEEIVAAIEQLLAQGDKLTISRVREALGNRGTPAIIAKILKERHPDSSVSRESMDMQQQSFNMDVEIPEAAEDGSSPNMAVNPQAPVANPHFVEIQPPLPNNEILKPASAEAAGVEAPSSPATETGDRRDKLSFKKRQYDGPRQREGEQQARPQHYHEHQQSGAQSSNNYQQEVYYAENLENLSEKELTVKIRRLEIYLNKEQSRREAAEKMAREAKEYAEAIKEQIGQRIADLREALEENIDRLKAEARDLKANAENDLKFYREQLEKANRKIISLINGEPDNKG